MIAVPIDFACVTQTEEAEVVDKEEVEEGKRTSGSTYVDRFYEMVRLSPVSSREQESRKCRM